jgi:hypothetical protein
MQQTKRHHFVPKAYLKAFCDGDGKLRVYRKDRPSEPLHVAPDAAQFRRYYYSQIAPDGARDNNGLEAFFSAIESHWPATVAALHARGHVNDRLENLFEFMSLQRVRVPATRDLVESMLAETVRSTLAGLIARGEVVPAVGLEDLSDHVHISIDPHQSLHAMAAMLQGLAPLYERLGLSVVHNATGLPFLTSDNPVIWFDPSVPFAQQRPYTLDSLDGPVLLLFPISPTVLILGSHDYRGTFTAYGLLHTDAPDRAWVEHVNAQVCRFAYEAVIAASPGQEALIAEFADVSPVHAAAPIDAGAGSLLWHRQVFGRRLEKPKWREGSDRGVVID